jgi:DNA replication licensing factor MCM6
VKSLDPEYAKDPENEDKHFFVAFFNMSVVEKVRGLRAEVIGSLVSIKGTVTRTSEVRPELLYGAFRFQLAPFFVH